MVTLNRRQFLLSTVLLPIALRQRPPSKFAARPRPVLPSGTPVGFGVGVPWHGEDFVPGWYTNGQAQLQPAWWYNWKFDRIGEPGYVPMLWKPELGDRFDAAVAAANAHPDQLWLFLNSPDRGAETTTSPANAAALANQWVNATSSPVSMPGIASNQIGIDWLKAYLDAGGPQPDVWHFHLYGFRHADEWLSGFSGTFADWYLAEGGNRPVILSETNGTTSSFEQQRSIMNAIVGVLAEDSPVVAIGWYSDHDPFDDFTAADLLHADGSLTALGQFYAGLNKTP